MHVMVLYNHYRHRVHGEEVVVESTDRLLRGHGVRVSRFSRSSEGFIDRPWGRVSAGLSSIYNPWSRQQLVRQLAADRPDVVHAHNLYPLISPSVLSAAVAAEIPVVMTIHHYGLSCPALTHYRAGRVCTACLDGNELCCMRFNCRRSRAESALYALRSAVARRFRLYLDGVTTFIALSQFAKDQLQQAGVPSDRIAIRPNTVQITAVSVVSSPREYIAYIGRITPEKGLDLLCEAALATRLPVRIAGDPDAWPELVARYGDSVRFVGVLRGNALADFYRQARFVVVPSRWWEVCPIVVLEAMNYCRPVIAARVGGLPEMVLDGVTGLLFEPGSTEDLAMQMRRLWDDSALCEILSAAARQRLVENYDESSYLMDLLKIYARALTARAQN